MAESCVTAGSKFTQKDLHHKEQVFQVFHQYKLKFWSFFISYSVQFIVTLVYMKWIFSLCFSRDSFAS